MPPTAFGPYSVVMSLGSGGMADVYLARDAKLDRLVAVKAPHRELVTAEIRARFRREAHAAAALEHPAIVPVYDYDESGELPYIVMRYLTGGSLEERIARQPYAPAEAWSILERVAAALDHAHSHGIIHRDVKSANILFDETGNAYVSDFGIAWMARAGDAGTRLTDTGVVRGTFDYISPEQARGERILDGRSDLYSLAVVLFEMLTGDVPYRAESGVFVAAQHISAPIPDIRQWRPDLPPALAAVMRRALAKQRDERYPTGAALVADLRRALAGGRVATPRPAATGQPAAGRRNLWLAIAAVAVLGVVLFALLRGRGSEPPATSGEPTAAGGETVARESLATEIAATEVVSDATPPPTSTTQPAGSPTPVVATPPQTGDSRALTLPDGTQVQQQFVPAGTFLMGSQDDPDAIGNESPQHEVSLAAFWIDQTEVTNDQFAAFVAATGHQTAAERQGQGRVRVETGWTNSAGVSWRRPADPAGPSPNGDLPVVQVSWDDALAYCAWAGGRLPTEAEWEYAARGRSGARYPWGGSFDGQATNFCDANCEFSWAAGGADDGFAGVAPVASFPAGASWVGAHDMVGNVWEWVNDWYVHGYYEESPANNPPGPVSGEFRILRGGAWYNEAKTMRAAVRGSDRPTDHDNGAGFRCVAGGAAAGAAPDEIVFQSNRDGDFEIYIMPATGGEAQQLTDNGAADNYPRVSPDGRHIVFVSERDGNPEIYVMNRDGSEQTRLTADAAREDLPAWSPDGRQIVFVSSRDGLMDVFIMDADGSSVRQITDSLEREGHVSWSVNDQLAYNGSRERYWQLWLSDADGANRRQLTNSTYDEWSPEWSPDGEWLLFLSERDSRTNPGIYVMRSDGSDARLVYNGSGEEWGAVWSADGTQIVFTAVQPDDSDNLYIMNADGGGLRLLTERGSYPSWAAAPPTITPSPTALLCPGAFPTRLTVGGRARVINYQLNIRAGPGTRFDIVRRLDIGRTVDILEGPVCDGGQLWYRIISEEIVPRDGSQPYRAEGWLIEESDDEYFLEPLL